uniref:Uncharacterized protein n=1 Tax=Theileria annulata TaxID=5874 RepID=A0A3B0NGI5_THEAN
MNRLFFRHLSNLTKKHDFLKINQLRQRGLLLTNLTPEILDSNDSVVKLFSKCNINICNDDVHIMRTRFGYPLGKALVLIGRMTPNYDFKFDNPNNDPEKSSENLSQPSKNLDFTNTTSLRLVYNSIIENLPKESSAYLCDEHEVSCYVEQCERLLTLPNDLRRISNPELLHRVVTITGAPRSYGRVELSNVIFDITKVQVDPKNIIFRFKANGDQDSLAWVICNSDKDVNTIISKIQEVPIPRRYQYGNLMGASFLYSSRSSFFLSHPSLDFITNRSKYQIFTMGWHSDVDEAELRTLTDSLKFYPKDIKIFKIDSKDPGKSETCAFLEFDRMRNTKKVMVRLQMIKNRWKIPDHSGFYAYPRIADVWWKSDNGCHYNDSHFNADLDEPIEY